MAEYNYKGYTANVYEDCLMDSWFTFLPEDAKYKVYLRSEFSNYESEICSESEAKTIRYIYIRYFEQAVDKHLRRFK